MASIPSDEYDPSIDDHAPSGSTRDTGIRVLLAIAVVLAFLIALTIGTGVAIGISELTGDRLHLHDLGAREALLLVASETVVLGCGVLVALVALREGWARHVGLGDGRFRPGFVALLPFAGATLLPGLLIAMADGSVVGKGVGVADAAAFLLLALVIGLAEELWFRGVLLRVLGGRTWQRPWLAVIGSAVMFGVPHLGSDAAAARNAIGVALAVGIPFAAVRIRHGALAPLVVWHALLDAFAFIHTSDVAVSGSPSVVEFVGALVLPTAVAVGYLSWFGRWRRTTGSPEPASIAGP